MSTSNDDVAAFLNARKKKKGKKKVKGFNATSLLETVIDGPRSAPQKQVVDAEVDLTDARGAAEKDEVWVDAVEAPAAATLQGLDDAFTGIQVREANAQRENTAQMPYSIEQRMRKQEVRNQFHATRHAALEKKSSGAAPKAAPAVVKPGRWVSASMRSGMHSSGSSANNRANLANLKSDKVFPTLGGKKDVSSSADAGGAWGRVSEDALASKREFERREAEALEAQRLQREKEKEQAAKDAAPLYLGADFISSDTFDGLKPGYAFTAGKQGQGYYWHETKEEDGEEGEDERAPMTAEEQAEAAAFFKNVKNKPKAWGPK